MGYEIKVYFGEYREPFALASGKKEKRGYFSVVGMVDLCKPGYYSQIMKLNKVEGKPVYFYAENGNTRIIKDRYDEKLKAIPVNEVIEALRIDLKDSKLEHGAHGYRRFALALESLEVFADRFDNAYVVLFGH